jgi:hypothetical protein
MHHVEIECGHRRSVKHGAYASHDNKVNAMPGQDFQYFQKTWDSNFARSVSNEST